MEYEIHISFKHGFTDVDELEMPAKGCRSDVIVKCPNGKSYQLCFYDPVRLKQDIEEEGMIYEVGLVVVPQVTLENIRQAALRMLSSGYFKGLMPL